MGPRFKRAPRWAPNDPVDNSSVEELPCRFLTPPMATMLSTRMLSGPSPGTSNATCKTQTAPLVAVCTPTLKLGHRISNKNNVCVSLSDSLFLFSLCLCLTEFCYAILCMCQNSVMLLCENVPQSVKTWVSVFSVCTFPDTEWTFIWVAPLSDSDTWRHATHI